MYLKDHDTKVPDDNEDMDDSSDMTPSKASKSPQKTSKRPKTVPVKVTLLDGSDYETGVEVCNNGIYTEMVRKDMVLCAA